MGSRAISPGSLRRERLGWIAWAVFALIVALVKYDSPATPGQVFNIYREAALRWMSGEPLFNGEGTGFLYLPTSAAWFIPMAHLPFALGGAIWRALNVGIFAIGVLRLSRCAGGATGRSLFPLASLIAIALSWSAARHGNMTLAMAGTMMLAADALTRHRWWSAATFLAVSVAIKPLSIVMLLLAGAVYPRVLWRTSLVLTLVLLLPFVTQHPEYVRQQYASVPDMFTAAAAWAEHQPFAQVFWMLETLGVSLAVDGRMLIRAIGAAVVLALCLEYRRSERGRPGLFLYTCAVCYTLLFNPRSERNTYALMAPALAVYTALSAAERRRTVSLFVGMTVACLLSHRLHSMFGGTLLEYIKPLVCLVFLCAVARWEWEVTWSLPAPASGPG